jgi:hypothetical protein
MGLELSCDWKAGFVMDPNKKQRVGYLVKYTSKKLGTEFLTPDIEVFSPYNAKEAAYKLAGWKDEKVTCVGVLENFSFGGGVGDPLCFSAYISAQNADKLAGKLKTTLESNLVDELAWWIVSFDEENKAWFEEAYPLAGDKGLVKGQINAPGGKDLRITVSQDPTKVAPNIDTNVYNFYVEVIPAADATYDFHFANSAKTKYVRRWGLKVGTNAAQAVGS